MKNEYEKLFDSFLELTEFTLVKNPDGWGLVDNQYGNLGGIESERFQNATQLLDCMDSYIEDYLVRAIRECLGIEEYELTWGEIAEKYKGKAGESESDILMLDAICNHSNEICLECCIHEFGSQKIYTVVSNSYSDGMYPISFVCLEEAINSMNTEANDVCKELQEQGYNAATLKRDDSVEVYVPDTDIYYDFVLFESELY